MKYKVGDWLLFYQKWDKKYEVCRISNIMNSEHYKTFSIECGEVYNSLGFSVGSPFEIRSIKIDKLELVDILYGFTNE